MSGFTDDKVQQELHRHDINLPAKECEKELTKIDVPILESKNIGHHMAVDEKYINGTFYTLLTNGQTGKIAMMASTTKLKYLNLSVQKFGMLLFNVRVLTRDLASNYDWFARENFINCTQVADKFHILKHAFEAIQDIRIYHRQKLLTLKREAFEEFRQQKKESNDNTLIFKFDEPKLQNNETLRQLLARGMYLLYKMPNQWSESQKTRAQILFKHYPDIQTAYELICEFRLWYSKDNIIDNQLDKKDKYLQLSRIKEVLEGWFKKVKQTDITEMLNFVSLIERNKGAIINYFYTGATNAIAESNNSIIQNLIHANRGAKNIDFFHFRIKTLMS